FGVSTGYRTPGLRRIAAMTCALSAICGTHLGETKLVASIAGRPASLSRSMRPTLTGVGTIAGSFCKPSRGPTSTMRTRRGRFMRGLLRGRHRASGRSSVSVVAGDHAGDGKPGLEPPDLGGDL